MCRSRLTTSGTKEPTEGGGAASIMATEGLRSTAQFRVEANGGRGDAGLLAHTGSYSYSTARLTYMYCRVVCTKPVSGIRDVSISPSVSSSLEREGEVKKEVRSDYSTT